MYNEITVDRSLLYIDEHHVNTFKSLAKNMSQFNFIIVDGGLTIKDAWMIAFNAWLLLQPNERNIIYSAEKKIYYSSNFVVIDELLKDHHFQYVKKYSNATQELYYLASLTLANNLNQWFLYIKNKYELHNIKNRDPNLGYFDFNKHSKKEALQLFLEEQAHFVKAVIKEFNSTNSFQKTIKQSCDEAFLIYKSHFANQSHKV